MNQEIFWLITTVMNIVIVALLIVIRNYQKQISKIKKQQLLIKTCANQSVNTGDLKDLQNKYDVLMKILNSIQEGKENEESSKNEKIS